MTLRWRGGDSPTSIFPAQVPADRVVAQLETQLSLLPASGRALSDEVIAGILNRQGRKTATGERFTANQVGSLRRYRNIPRFQPPASHPLAKLVSIRKAAHILGMNTSTIHRWLADGFIAGEQVTPGAPWQIRITDELRGRIVQHAPPEYLPMLETTIKLGVSRQTVLQRVKRGELEAVLVRQGRRKGLRIKVIRSAASFIRTTFMNPGAVWNRIEEALDVQIARPSHSASIAAAPAPLHPAPTSPGDTRRNPDGTAGPPPAPVSTSPPLRDPIRHGRYAQLPFPTVCFRYLHRPHRRRKVTARRHPIPDLVQVPLQVSSQNPQSTAHRPLPLPCSLLLVCTLPRPPTWKYKTALPHLIGSSHCWLAH